MSRLALAKAEKKLGPGKLCYYETIDKQLYEIVVYLEFLRSSFASLPATAELANRKLSVSWIEKQKHNLPLRRSPWESSITLLPDVASCAAISLAASRRRSSRKPLFLRNASPTSSAAWASPCARTMMDYQEVWVSKLCIIKRSWIINVPAFLEWPGQPGKRRAKQFVGQPKKAWWDFDFLTLHEYDWLVSLRQRA